jgi:hypothetical protein
MICFVFSVFVILKIVPIFSTVVLLVRVYGKQYSIGLERDFLPMPLVGTIFLFLVLCSIIKKESELITWYDWQQHGIFWILEIKWSLMESSRMLLHFCKILNIFRGCGLVGVLLEILVFHLRIGVKILWVLFLALKGLRTPCTPL